jgi:hypothetical protein
VSPFYSSLLSSLYFLYSQLCAITLTSQKSARPIRLTKTIHDYAMPIIILAHSYFGRPVSNLARNNRSGPSPVTSVQSTGFATGFV